MCVCSVRTFSNHLRGVTFGKLRRDQKRKNPSDSQKEPNVATAIDFFLGFPSGSIRISGDPETGPKLKQKNKKKKNGARLSGQATRVSDYPIINCFNLEYPFITNRGNL